QTIYKGFLSIALFGLQLSYAQQQTLTVEQIMRDPKWIGTSPDGAFWGADGALYFTWNPEAEEVPSLYRITPTATKPQRVDSAAREAVVRQYSYSPDRKQVVFERGGDLYLRELWSGTETRLANTVQRESNPHFNHDGTRIFFQQGDNLFSVSRDGGEWTQLTNFVREAGEGHGPRGGQGKPETEQNKWLADDQLDLFEVLQTRQRRDSLRDAGRADGRSDGQPKRIPIG